MSDERERITDNQDNDFGPETGVESESSVSDKAFFQADAVDPIAQQARMERDEEYAAEVAAPLRYSSPRTRSEAYALPERRVESSPRTALGYFAMIMAVLSLFVIPSILGPASAVIGFMAYVRGSKALGVWSIVIGTIAFVSFLTTIPYHY